MVSRLEYSIDVDGIILPHRQNIFVYVTKIFQKDFL
jgi:hypothetical protein